MFSSKNKFPKLPQSIKKKKTVPNTMAVDLRCSKYNGCRSTMAVDLLKVGTYQYKYCPKIQTCPKEEF